MVRPAKLDETPQLLWVLKAHYNQLMDSHPQYAVWRPAYLNRTLRWAIESDNWIVLTNNKLDGIMIASFFESPFGIGKFAQEHLLRVGSSRLSDFRVAYEAWATDAGCIKCSIGCIERAEAFGRVLRPHGYTKGETVFTKDLGVV